ncbi:MAG TPA: type VI secretion system protein TssA, partial [Edaphobacter sp.]|nr:type VI secretion system protein TssA [Edaphobacter sp.]
MMGPARDPLHTDLDHLMAPISAERPCGEWLRYQGTYDQVREMRREDDAGLPQGVWQSELKRADWGAVETLCAEALVHRSKDLQLAAWLLEAWIQLDSFTGAWRGIELMRRLCSDFWEQMYPALDGQDLAARLAPIRWVNEKLARRLRRLRLTRPGMESVLAYSLADWDVALRNPGDGGQQESITMAKFQQSVTLTSYQWFTTLRQQVLGTIDRVEAFDEFMDEKVGKLAPGLLQFRSEASSVEQLLESMLSVTRGNQPEPVKEASSALALGSPAESYPGASESLSPAGNQAEFDASQNPASSGVRIRTRADAYRLLEEIAVFLHQNDPHSPTPYLIWRAVAWGNMHFDELLP